MDEDSDRICSMELRKRIFHHQLIVKVTATTNKQSHYIPQPGFCPVLLSSYADNPVCAKMDANCCN